MYYQSALTGSSMYAVVHCPTVTFYSVDMYRVCDRLVAAHDEP